MTSKLPKRPRNGLTVFRVTSETISIRILLLLRSFWVVTWIVCKNFEFGAKNWPRMVSNGPKIAQNDINFFWIPDGPILPKYSLYVLWFLLSISIGSNDTKSMLYDSAGIVFAASTNLLDGRFVKELHRHNLRPAAQTASSHQSAWKKWNKISSHLRTLHYHKIIKLRQGTTVSSQEQNGFTIHERNQSINLQGEKNLNFKSIEIIKTQSERQMFNNSLGEISFLYFVRKAWGILLTKY